MRPAIGVMGPGDLVEIMLSAARGFEHYRFIDLRYAEETECISIYKANREKLDVCLFAGDWPYLHLVEHLGSELDLPCVYVREAGPAVHKTVAHLLLAGIDVRRVSIDTMLREEGREAFGEIGLSTDAMRFMEYEGHASREEITAFHRDLWRAGETSGAITFLKSAYEVLKQEGLPVYRCTPSVGALKEAVARAVLEAQSLETRGAQLAFGLVEVRTPREDGSGFKTQKLKAILFQALLEWGEPNGISVVPMEGLRFGLIATRGALEEITSGYRSFPGVHHIGNACGCNVSFGFGVARTTSLCYADASLALSYAREFEGSCAYVIHDGGQVVGPLGGTHRLEFSRSTLSQSVISNALSSGLAIATIGRVQAVLKANRSTLITPEQLAFGLSISKRNARRILSKLCDAGIAEVSGLDQPGPRGRPQRVYKVNLE